VIKAFRENLNASEQMFRVLPCRWLFFGRTLAEKKALLFCTMQLWPQFRQPWWKNKPVMYFSVPAQGHCLDCVAVIPQSVPSRRAHPWLDFAHSYDARSFETERWTL